MHDVLKPRPVQVQPALDDRAGYEVCVCVAGTGARCAPRAGGPRPALPRANMLAAPGRQSQLLVSCNEQCTHPPPAQVHYIPTTASNLERAVRYCLDHDAQCEQMAARMRQTMLSVARVEEVEEYTFLLLRRLQAWAETRPAVDM